MSCRASKSTEISIGKDDSNELFPNYLGAIVNPLDSTGISLYQTK